MNNSSLAASLRVWKNPVVVIFLALVCATLIPTSGRAQQFTDTLRCGKIDMIDIGQVLTLDSVTYPVSFINYFPSDSLWIVGHGNPTFRIVENQGSVSQGSSWQAHVVFIAGNTLGSISTTDTIIQSQGCTVNVLLKAQVIGPTKDSSIFSLQSHSPQTIAFKTTDSNTTGIFYLKNTSDSSIVINSITISGTNAFSITSHQFPDTLMAGNSLPLDIRYHRNSLGSDNGYFAISRPDQPIAPFEIALQGVRTSSDAVQSQPSVPTYVWLYPNPTQGSVTIETEHLTQASVTTTDMLGRMLSKATFSGDFVWNEGASMSGGTYFVAISGVTLDGFHIHEVHRVEVLR